MSIGQYDVSEHISEKDQENNSMLIIFPEQQSYFDRSTFGDVLRKAFFRHQNMYFENSESITENTNSLFGNRENSYQPIMNSSPSSKTLLELGKEFDEGKKKYKGILF